MAGRQSRVDGLDGALSYFDSVPAAARDEMAVELGIIGREILAAQHRDVAKDTGALDAALSLQVLLERLKVRIGLMRGGNSASKSNGRARKARAGGPFYGVIVEKGRAAQTVNVTRRIKKPNRKIKGNNKNGDTRRTVFQGAQKRRRPASSPNAGTFMGTPYKMRVPAMAGRPFVEQPMLQDVAEQHLSEFWAQVLTRTGGGQ
ncbi:hypothetical protein [Sphingomonas hengshuiensis]|uniref:Uncharacterized protein n=1 Tax=Sphingomonas hengshuiensis TaxID=1609977 RepID=A0A7U4J9W0_9SPHN|nr:hypothetical protein [Sphingomonas hengshuiensis]AJP72930.1 hypothetical protein TS85_15720 [Sphingomonas hengshuiensis]